MCSISVRHDGRPTPMDTPAPAKRIAWRLRMALTRSSIMVGSAQKRGELVESLAAHGNLVLALTHLGKGLVRALGNEDAVPLRGVATRLPRQLPAHLALELVNAAPVAIPEAGAGDSDPVLLAEE